MEEIVVTARRSGIPVWRVTGPRTTLILVGAIENVAKGTRWDPANLTQAMLKSDRVMFPQVQDYKASPVTMISFAIRWVQMSKLPKGQRLRSMVPDDQFRRLLALQQRGILKPDFDSRHPLHLSLQLHEYAEGRAGLGWDAYKYVRRAAKKHGIKRVPPPKPKINKTLDAFFASKAQAHVDCLLASVEMAETGPGAMKERSDAWAARRITDVLNSPAQRALEKCSLSEYEQSLPDWRATVKRLLTEPEVTLAVLDLHSLAQPGGLLDELKAAGFDVRGPSWR